MPNGQKCQGTKLTCHSVIEKAQSFVDIIHNPCIGIDIEAINNVLESRGFLKDPESHIGPAVPLDTPVFPAAIVSQTGKDDSAFGKKPRGNVFGQDDFDPGSEVQALQEESQVLKFSGFDKTHGGNL